MDSRNNNIYPGYEQIEIDRLSYYINIGDTNNAVALAQKLAANNIKINDHNSLILRS